MKKSVLLFTVLVAVAVTVRAQSRWSVGVQSGLFANVSKFDGGDENANALFSNQPFKTFHLDASFRYKLNERFSFVSGFDFTEIGFTYQLAKDYSLLRPEKQHKEMNAGTCITGIPVMALITTPLNCTGTRIVAGAGIVLRGIDSNWESEKNETIEVSINGRGSEDVQIISQSKAAGFISAAATWSVGFEKVFLKGNMITLSFRGQQGLSTIAKSSVTYTADGNEYNHNFINRGSSASFVFAYYFAPLGKRTPLAK